MNILDISDDNRAAVVSSAEEWARCLFSKFKRPGYDPIEEGDCADGPEHKPAIVFMAGTMTFVICLGFGMYVIYGSRSEYVKLWKNELAAKGFIGTQSSVRNASNVNGTICSSRVEGNVGKKKKKKGFFGNNSVMSSGRVSNGGSSNGSIAVKSIASSTASSSSHSSSVEDSEPDPATYIPPRHILNQLKKKEKEITKYDKTCGVYAQTEAVEEVREDKTSFTIHIGEAADWADNIPEHLEATEGAVKDLRDSLYLMTKACTFPELQGWICAKYNYDPLHGAVFLKPVIELQDRTQALLGVKYHWHSGSFSLDAAMGWDRSYRTFVLCLRFSLLLLLIDKVKNKLLIFYVFQGDFLWIKQKSGTRVECFKMVMEEINDVAHHFDPTPLFEECKNMSLAEVYRQYRELCQVDTSCPYWK